MSASKNILERFRDVAQDLLVPDVKAVKVSVEALRADMKTNTEAIRSEMKLSNDALREEMKLRQEASDRQTKQLFRALPEKLDFTIEVRERLASIEARMPRQ